MKEKIKTTFKKWTTSLITLLTLVNALFTTTIPVHANTSVLVLDEPTNLYYTGVSPHTETSILSRSYNLYSTIQRADDIEVILPAEAGEKHKKGTVKNDETSRRHSNEKEKTFGELKFSALRREVKVVDNEGNVTEQIKERTSDLKSKGQGRMIQVSIPTTAGEKEFDYNSEVELINPVADTAATATFQGANVDWYIKADDLLLKKTLSNPSPAQKPTQNRK